MADYEEVVRVRRANDEDDGAVGEALSELGFGYLCQGRFRKGVQFMEEGTSMLVGSSARIELTARALRKLAMGYFVTGRIRQARETRAVAHEFVMGTAVPSLRFARGQARSLP